jgi:hypothetical protein
MSANGKTRLQIRRPLFPELREMREDVRHMLRGMRDTRWPLMTPFRAFRGGVLEVVVPRKATAKSKKVVVTAA